MERKKQAYNPYLPSYEYIPDGEPHIFDGRVYIYGSHDRFNGASFCLNDYVTYSAPIDDLSSWRYEGVIFKRKEDPNYKPGIMNAMWAPDVAKGKDGLYYLYYFLGHSSRIHVAVSNSPKGPFSYYGSVHYPNGDLIGSRGEGELFDPSIFIDDDGKIYLYVGFGRTKPTSKKIMEKGRFGAMCFELKEDMLTAYKDDFAYIGVPSYLDCEGTSYPKEHAFFEAASLRKFNGSYYFIYSSFSGHELCYARSDSPLGPFEYRGVLISNGDIGTKWWIDSPKNALDFTGNNHGSIIKIKDQYYVFYHRQTNRNQFSRQACAEKIEMKEDGDFVQAERTSCGLNDGPLLDKGVYEARIACNLISHKGNRFYMILKKTHTKEPYFTQTGKDRENKGDQYISHISNGDLVGFKYFDFKDASRLDVSIKGTGVGKIEVRQKIDGAPLGYIDIEKSPTYRYFGSSIEFKKGVHGLFLIFKGKGTIDFNKFRLS